MTAASNKAPSKESLILLDALQQAVSKALDKKRRLGQYAVVWRDGKPVTIGNDASSQILDHSS